MTTYPTDISEAQFKLIEHYFDTKRKRKWSVQQILNGILYLVKTGIQWRMMPSDLPPWQTVYWFGVRHTSVGSSRASPKWHVTVVLN